MTDAPASEPRIPWPFRISKAGKQAAEKYARGRGYKYPTEWVRDLVAAEVTNPKHNLKPKE